MPKQPPKNPQFAYVSKATDFNIKTSFLKQLGLYQSQQILTLWMEVSLQQPVINDIEKRFAYEVRFATAPVFGLSQKYELKPVHVEDGVPLAYRFSKKTLWSNVSENSRLDFELESSYYVGETQVFILSETDRSLGGIPSKGFTPRLSQAQEEPVEEVIESNTGYFPSPNPEPLPVEETEPTVITDVEQPGPLFEASLEELSLESKQDSDEEGTLVKKLLDPQSRSSDGIFIPTVFSGLEGLAKSVEPVTSNQEEFLAYFDRKMNSYKNLLVRDDAEIFDLSPEEAHLVIESRDKPQTRKLLTFVLTFKNVETGNRYHYNLSTINHVDGELEEEEKLKAVLELKKEFTNPQHWAYERTVLRS